MATENVTVACKLPNGLICRIFEPRQELDQVVGGGSREVTRHYPNGQQFVLNGTAREMGQMPRARLANGAPGTSAAQMLDTGFALTHGVPKDLWDRWYDANKDADFVRNGLVFAHKQGASVKRQAKEHEALTSGFEPIDPENPGGEVESTDQANKLLRTNRLKGI
jgi:hypothetical protein